MAELPGGSHMDVPPIKNRPQLGNISAGERDVSVIVVTPERPNSGCGRDPPERLRHGFNSVRQTNASRAELNVPRAFVERTNSGCGRGSRRDTPEHRCAHTGTHTLFTKF